jgi:glucan phosphoethanolaminetransferase (alkaline phosphatase superfamily)
MSESLIPSQPKVIPGAFSLPIALRSVVIWWGFHLLLGGIFILLFSSWNQLGGWKYKLLFLVFHWVINAGLWLVVFIGCGVFLQTKLSLRWPWLRRVVTIVPGVVFVLLLLLWLIDWVTTLHWGGNISDQLAWEIIRHFGDYAKLLPLKVYAFLVAAIVIVFLLYQRWMSKTIQTFGAVFPPLRSKRGVAILLVGLMSYGLLFALLWHPWMVQWNYWQREPLVSFFLLSRGHLLFPEQAQAFLPATPRRLQSAERDQRLRQNYPRSSFQKRNVILITVDSWRADHLPFYGYPRQTSPFLSKLYAEGRLRKITKARATCNATYCAVLSVLASRNVPDLGQGLFKLHDVLKDQGYEIHFLLSGIHTAWYDLRRLYGESVDHFFDGTLARNFVANDDRGVLEKLAQTQPYTGQPAFFYFHLMAPHLVGLRLPEYAEWQPTTNKLRMLNDPMVNVNTYDQGVRMADAMMEKIFVELEAKGYLQESVAFILGDHGEALGEHQHYSHGLSLYEEALRIPLLIVDSPDVTYQNLSSALQLDVAPTILDRLGLPIPASWQGQSLLRNEPHTISFHQAGFQPQQAVIYREREKVWKYISNEKTKAEELYELQRDPREERNLIQSPEAHTILPRLRKLLAQQ